MQKYITQNPKILGGKPIIKGTRISVEIILEMISSGLTVDDILKEYPFLKRAQVDAALKYAAELVKKQEIYIFDKAQKVLHEISGRR